MRADRLTSVVAYHGEGPVWWPEWGLRICDVYAGDILRVDVSDGRVTERLHVGESVGAFRPRLAGGLVAGIERGIALVDADGKVQRLPDLWSDPTLRMNDGACDWFGNFYCGRLREHEPREGHGVVYRLGDPVSPPSVVLRGQGIPNGLVFDEASGRAFYIDTLTRSVRRYVLDEAGWQDDGVSVDLTGTDAYPDGMTIDVDGRLWIAMWGAGTVNCYAPGSSRTLEQVTVPGTVHVTAATFGGEDLGTLFITTTRESEPEDVDGSVFAVRPGATGRPTLAYSY
jgi:sugar lactone lactonase YvrE